MDEPLSRGRGAGVRGLEASCAGPEAGFFAGEHAPRHFRARAAVAEQDVDEIDTRRTLRGARAVEVRELVTRRRHRTAAVVRRRARRLAVVAPTRIGLTQAID